MRDYNGLVLEFSRNIQGLGVGWEPSMFETLMRDLYKAAHNKIFSDYQAMDICVAEYRAIDDLLCQIMETARKANNK